MKFATGTISRRRSSYGTARTDLERAQTAVEHPALRSAGQLAVVPTSPAHDTTPAARRRLSGGHEASRRVPASRLPWCLEGRGRVWKPGYVYLSTRDRLNGPAQPLDTYPRDLACQITGAHPLAGGTPVPDFSGRRLGWWVARPKVVWWIARPKVRQGYVIQLGGFLADDLRFSWPIS